MVVLNRLLKVEVKKCIKPTDFAMRVVCDELRLVSLYDLSLVGLVSIVKEIKPHLIKEQGCSQDIKNGDIISGRFQRLVQI